MQEETDLPARSGETPTVVSLFLVALFLSGFAAIVNESVWQRALKIYLAGCESASSMIIVVVFMLGLGAGSLCMGLAASLVKNPVRAIALVEIGLFLANVIIAAGLAADPGDSIYAVQRLALSLGAPLRAVYGVSAAVALLIPCFLMGITMPLASEVAQRQLHCQNSRYVTTLFVLNTLGSVLGGIAGGFLLMPYFGQLASLLLGASCNLVAGLILLLVWRARFARREWAASGELLHFRRGRLTTEEILGFWLGFLSLAYEMYLFRVAALAHQPLPYNFSLVLCYFLLYWSVGVFLARKITVSLDALLLASAALVATTPGFHLVDRMWLHGLLAGTNRDSLPLFFSAMVYSLPCIPFGWLFGLVMTRSAKNWGADVGRFYALNTMGSCLGIVAMHFIGYEMNHAYAAFLIAAGYIVLIRLPRRANDSSAISHRGRLVVGGIKTLLVSSIVVLLPTHALFDWRPGLFSSKPRIQKRVCYNGVDGVVEIWDRDMFWNGLWHSALAKDGSQIGTNNWFLATVPVLCHGGSRIDDALVVGLGTGITAATLAASDRVGRVDAYEIDRQVERVLRDFPDGTLRVAENPKVRIIWQDGRSGLALNDKKYDLITQQPLYLKQAGSGILLSREYFQLVRKRLKKNGVFCIYSNCQGETQQAHLVRKTAASVFPYCESFGEGYMIVASDSPFTYDTTCLDDSANRDPLVREMRLHGARKIRDYHDVPRLNWSDLPAIITDDHPLIEYPAAIRRIVAARQLSDGAPLLAPPPRASH